MADLSDKLSIYSHIFNLSIVLYIISITLLSGTFEPIHQIITMTGLIFSIIVNIIGILFRRK